jgi:type I restriction enzyme S subunit
LHFHLCRPCRLLPYLLVPNDPHRGHGLPIRKTSCVWIPGGRGQEVIAKQRFSAATRNPVVWQKHYKAKTPDEGLSQQHFCKSFYYLSTLDLNKCNEGTGVPSVTADRLYDLDIKVPSFCIQKHIVDIIGSIDEKIQIDQFAISQLKKTVEEVFTHWFLRFAYPCESGQPFRETKDPKKFSKDFGTTIPSNWSVDRLGKHIKIKKGISYSSDDLLGNGIPMISLGSFATDGSFISFGMKTYSGKYCEKDVVKPFDLLLCCTQQTAIDKENGQDVIGRAMICPDIFKGSDVVISTDIAKIEVDDSLNVWYLKELLSKDFLHRYLSGFANGTKIKHLDTDGLLDCPALVPDPGILSKFGKYASSAYQKISALSFEILELKKQKETLLPLLLNGEVS